ncbi:hypothetical protein C8A05DRAFT_15434 [Staphylotrichum tortipilum]|uniref:Transcription factor domain-containing protein n=1 Tax=Staphylotrichum tortipilum TaxID=2831512 RepID=A0AAN6MME3_9PEZI|nr:hypothetical protein C8A05DRAFT_15434 [Staphylotrichum longicolle]
MAGAGGRPAPQVQPIKFVGHDVIGLPVKRKQVVQACLPCRKRKKRCHHVEAGSPGPTAASVREDQDQASADSRAARAGPRRQGGDLDRDTSDAAAQLLRFFHHAADKASTTSPDDDPRQQMSPAPPFLGDLNPEGILVEATLAPTQKSPESEKPPDAHVIGFVPPTSPRQARVSLVQERRTGNTGNPIVDESSGPFFSIPRGDGTRFTIPVQDTAKFAALAQTLVNQGLADKVIPSDTEWRAMRDLYLAKIHPIFPMFDRFTLVNLPEEIALRELIQACVCLAAATDPEACSFLTFKSRVEGVAKSQTKVLFEDYSREMANFINRRLTELQDVQQIPVTVQIQVMALTCLYWQPASPTQRFEPLYLYSRLVSLVHTHGIHLGLLVRGQPEDSSEGSGTRLFKCLYALDRLLGAIAARPLMFHNVDLMEVPRPDASDPPIFRLFMSLILLLDQVIELYRPQPKVSYVDVPVYERMAIEAGAQCEPESLLATLEVLYHAIGVLSVRMPRHRFRAAPECDTLPGPGTQHLPPSSVNARRSHSADRILDVIRDYKLSPMPFIPYALTLSLSVAYRKWRFSVLPMFRTRGGADFKGVLPALQAMGGIWSSARINGQLGEAVMLKLDQSEINRKRAKRTAEAARVKRIQTGAAAEGGDGDLTEPPGQRDAQAAGADIPSSPRQPPGHPQASGVDVLRPPLTSQPLLPSPATSSPADQPPPPPPEPHPLTWTATWVSDIHHPDSFPWSKEPTTTTTTTTTSTTQPPNITSAYSYGPTADAIPLPGDVLPPVAHSQPQSQQGYGEASNGGNLDEFLMDDDALFRSWDPRFAQSVDMSFSSILDPGNPFAWPEYGGYML